MALDDLNVQLWTAASTIRGYVGADKFKDYIIPLLFYKRLCDVFEDELQLIANKKDKGDLQKAHKRVEKERGLVRFFVPQFCMWSYLINQGDKDLGTRLTDALKRIGKENPELLGVIDRCKFDVEEAGIRIIPDHILLQFLQDFGYYRLGLKDATPDVFGTAYEFMLRKFAEDSGQSAGEYFTPPEVGKLMAIILDPNEGETIYDPACGSGGLLIRAQLRLQEKLEKNAKANKPDNKPSQISSPLRLYGQEINHDTFAMVRMNALIHDMKAKLYLGDTLSNPATLDDQGQLMKFDKVIANPMWNLKVALEIYLQDKFERFKLGYPPSSSADWGWVQHMMACLAPNGKLAVILDTGAVSRGSGSKGKNRERDIRKAIVEQDLVELVVLLPNNLFYNTNSPGVILVINKAKKDKSHVMMINASREFEKSRVKCQLGDVHIEKISYAYQQWKASDNFCAIVSKALIAENDYNLTPSRYVSLKERKAIIAIEDALIDWQQLEAERQAIDTMMNNTLTALGFGDFIPINYQK